MLVGYETFAGRICELDGTVVAPGALVDWLDQAWVERVVLDGPDRVKNVGVRRRTFAGAPAAEHCQIDHVQPWSAGGLTVDNNGRAACGYHNRWRHRRTGQPP